MAETLSEAERRVVEAMLAGHTTTKSLARELHLSGRTIDTHISRILEKLNVENRAQLILVAVQQGWLEKV